MTLQMFIDSYRLYSRKNQDEGNQLAWNPELNSTGSPTGAKYRSSSWSQSTAVVWRWTHGAFYYPICHRMFLKKIIFFEIFCCYWLLKSDIRSIIRSFDFLYFYQSFFHFRHLFWFIYLNNYYIVSCINNKW